MLIFQSRHNRNYPRLLPKSSWQSNMGSFLMCCNQQLRHRGPMMYRKLLRWWLLMYIIRRLIDQLQWRLKLVVRQQRFVKRLHCFRQRWYIRCSWIQQLRRYIGMYHLQQCMGMWLLIRYRWLQRIQKRSPLNHHHILGFRMMLNNQLIVILRMITSFCWWWNWDLLMILWLRMPSMIRIVLDSWLV